MATVSASRQDRQRSAAWSLDAVPWLPAVAVTLVLSLLFVGDAVVLPHGPTLNAARPFVPGPLGNLMHWDGLWYQFIAEHWYVVVQPLSGQQPANFLPLFPGLVRLLHLALPFASVPVLGVSLNVVALCAAMALVDRTVRDWPLRHRLLLVALLVSLPGAFFYTAFYTEALFTFSMALTIFAVTRDRTWLAALGCALATYDRVIGIILILPVIVMVVRHRRASEVPAILLAACGALGLFATYEVARGDPLAFVHAQAAGWGDHLYEMSFSKAVHSVAHNMLLKSGAIGYVAAGLWEAAAVVPLIALTLWKWRRDLAVTGALLWVCTVVSGGYTAQVRYMLVLLPVWIGTVAVVRRWRFGWIPMVIAVLAGLLVNFYLIDQFARWGWAA